MEKNLNNVEGNNNLSYEDPLFWLLHPKKICKTFDERYKSLSKKCLESLKSKSLGGQLNTILQELSKMKISFVEEYATLQIDPFEKDASKISRSISSALNLLRKSLIVGEDSPEKKEYITQYKEFFDTLYKKYEIGYTSATYCSTNSLRSKYLSFTSEEQRYIKDVIEKNDYYKKSMNISIFNNLKSIVDSSSSVFPALSDLDKKEIITYRTDVQKFLTQPGASVECDVLIGEESLSKKLTSISIDINNSNISFIFSDGIREVRTLENSMNDQIFPKFFFLK